MKLIKTGHTGIALIMILLASGCTNIKKLEEENALLNERVSELEQVKNDYSDKLANVEQLNRQEMEALQRETDAMRADLTEKLASQIRENEVLLEKVESLTVITLGEAALFGSGLADLSEEGSKTIERIADALALYPGYHVRVEGHTDSMPIGSELKAQFASNWELSAARASSVVRYMIYGLNMNPERLSTVGFAHYRPVDDNATKEGREKNRRIRVVVFKEILQRDADLM